MALDNLLSCKVKVSFSAAKPERRTCVEVTVPNSTGATRVVPIHMSACVAENVTTKDSD